MTLSKLITHLQDLQQEHGDLPVVVQADIMNASAYEYINPLSIDCHTNIIVSTYKGNILMEEVIIINTLF